MANKQKQYRYEPDYTLPPGETLLEVLETKGMSQTELALRTGRTLKTINEIIKGKAAITAETSLQLERVLGVPSSFWNNLERNYRADLAAIEERNRLEANVEWVRQFPVRALVKMGAIRDARDPAAQVIEILSFFGVASPEAWYETWSDAEVVYRRSPAFKSSPGAVSAWLRLGENRAQAVSCAPYNRERFRSALATARALTLEPPEVIQSELTRVCAEAGVAVVFVPELPKTHLSGATRWLSPVKALIQLILRHKSDDHLWFCFFHEAGHILLHGKKDMFLEGDGDQGEKERQANEFAADFLIPPSSYRTFATNRLISKAAIERFAESIGIAAGIVVGRLQHDGLLPPSHCNDLKQRYAWAQEKIAV